MTEPHRDLPLVHIDRRQANGQPFHVRTLLSKMVPQGLRRLTSDRAHAIDVRLYFRTKPNGDEWGELAIIDHHSGKLLKAVGEDYVGLPLHSPEALQWFLSELVYEGWANHRERQEPRGPDVG